MLIALCSDEEGGEHLLVDAEPEDLEMMDIRFMYDDAQYDDGFETWQGPSEAIENAWDMWGVEEEG